MPNQLTQSWLTELYMFVSYRRSQLYFRLFLINYFSGTTNNFKHRGIIPRAISQLYQEIKERHEEDFKVKISYLEIYKEHMYDLLATLPAKGSLVDSCEMSVTEDSLGRIYVKGLRCYPAESEEDALNLLFEVRIFNMMP